jgi:hypothetical protein
MRPALPSPCAPASASAANVSGAFGAARRRRSCAPRSPSPLAASAGPCCPSHCPCRPSRRRCRWLMSAPSKAGTAILPATPPPQSSPSCTAAAPHLWRRRHRCRTLCRCAGAAAQRERGRQVIATRGGGAPGAPMRVCSDARLVQTVVWQQHGAHALRRLLHATHDKRAPGTDHSALYRRHCHTS